jgi:hypothetical protein
MLRVIKNFLIVIFLIFSSNVYAELTPLKEHLKNNHNWELESTELAYVCIRCGTLMYLVNEYTENNVDKKTTNELKLRSDVYLEFGEMVSKANGQKDKALLERMESILILYANEMIENKKINNNVFTGFVGDDLEICAENFEKVSKVIENLANKIEDNTF